jgi:dipeptidyl-peptidase-4
MIAAAWLVGCSATQKDPAGAADKPKHFDPVVQNMEGFTVYIDPKLLDDENAEEDAAALDMLRNHLQRINVLFAKSKAKDDLQSLGIWIEEDHDIDVEPGPYHPGKDWLIERGYDGRLENKVHITRAASLLELHHMLKHPMVVLHELAHAYHDEVLGFDDPRIIAAYKQAMDKGLYDKVLTYTGREVEAYAATNEKEYFAEATEAYFYRNDFYPFLGAELKRHDPVGYDLMVEIWGPLE